MPNEHSTQTDLIKSALPKNGARVGVALVIMFFNALLFVGNLYLSNGYVSKATYETDQKEENNRREKLNMELRGVAVELKGLNDHMEAVQQREKR